MPSLSVGDPGYGVPGGEAPPTTEPPKKLRNKPDPREFLNPKRFASPPKRAAETRSDGGTRLVTRQGPLPRA